MASLLPVEIQQMIAYTTADPMTAIVLMDAHTLKNILKHMCDFEKNSKLLNCIQTLCSSKNPLCLRYIHWLVKNSFVTKKDLLKGLMSVTDIPQIEKVLKVFNLDINHDFNLLNVACENDNINVIRRYYSSYNNLPNPDKLYRAPRVLDYLQHHREPNLFNRDDYIKFFIAKGDLTFLKVINTCCAGDIRWGLRNRDITQASDRGHNQLLQWIHEVCPCFTGESLYCMFPSSVRSRESWSDMYTPHNFDRSYFYFPLSQGGVWFR